MPQLDPQTETAVANQALSLIKSSSILSIDTENSNRATECKLHFAAVRDALQRRYPWNFNEEYKSLPAAADAPLFKFRRRFPWTSDMLGVREVRNCPRSDWKVQGKSILSNASAPLHVVASVRVTDVSKWDPLFRWAMVCALAAAIAPGIAKDDDTTALMERKAREAIEDAFPVDANEGTPDEPETQDVIAERY